MSADRAREPKDTLDSTYIEVLSGVSAFTREGFCTVVVDGRHAGQMDPNEVRTMALSWLEAAEAAESDAMVLAELTSEDGMGLDDQVALAFIGALRRRRSPT